MLIVGFKVIIAANGDQKILLQKLFPSVEFISPPAYALKYSTTRWRTIAEIILQIPKILTAINKENNWLKQIAKDKHLDIVISDNRYGLYHAHITSVFVTHQLLIKTPFGGWVNSFLQRLNYRFIHRFDYCWVPDAPTAPFLAGELSHPKRVPRIPLRYIGAQSGISSQPTESAKSLLVLLSGPEPQRSILEQCLLQQLQLNPQQVQFVRGLPAATAALSAPAGVTVHNFVTGPALEKMINEAAIIICRAGYSSMMDLLPLGKRCIFIPTPGQSEQEYLGEWMRSNKYAVVVTQQKFSLPAALAEALAMQVPNLSQTKNEQLLQDVITEVQDVIRQKQQSSAQ